MEVRNPNTTTKPVKAMLFDFDGTVSTLRCGWEQVMQPLFVEQLDDGSISREELERKVAQFIDESTGIQTIQQMKWLRDEVMSQGREPLDIWEYKKMYNDRLMDAISTKIMMLLDGSATPDSFLMAGAVEFLKILRDRRIAIYVASGTDHPDVVNEARALQVFDLFDEVHGAPIHEESCSKEAVIQKLLQETGLHGDDLCVCGDGKVEIALGKSAGARTIGLASNEKARRGIDTVKRERLIKAGADVIIGDFLNLDEIMRFLGL